MEPKKYKKHIATIFVPAQSARILIFTCDNPDIFITIHNTTMLGERYSEYHIRGSFSIMNIDKHINYPANFDYHQFVDYIGGTMYPTNKKWVQIQEMQDEIKLAVNTYNRERNLDLILK